MGLQRYNLFFNLQVFLEIFFHFFEKISILVAEYRCKRVT